MSRRAVIFAIVCAAALLGYAFAAAPESGLILSATTVNVAGAPEPVRIEILRWSTEDERERLMAAWELRATAPANAKGGGKNAGKANKGGDAAKAGKGGAGKGGAKGGGAPAAAAPEITPAVSLARALDAATTVGYLWSSEVAGYALRYAGRFTSPDGSQRVVLMTQRRLGAVNQRWTPDSGDPNKLEFSVIELRLNSKNEGEGRASLTGTLAADPSLNMLTLANAPVVFRDVKTAAK